MPSETSPLLQNKPNSPASTRPPLLQQVTTNGNGTNGTFKNGDGVDAEAQPLLNGNANGTALDGKPAEEDKPKVNMMMLLPAIAIGIMLSAMDNTIVVSSYGSIGSDLKELNRTSWIATS
jgi:hypothetical protein